MSALQRGLVGRVSPHWDTPPASNGPPQPPLRATVIRDESGAPDATDAAAGPRSPPGRGRGSRWNRDVLLTDDS